MRLLMEWIALANPSRFLALAERLLPWLAAATAIAFAAGLYAAFFVAPEDYQQGATVCLVSGALWGRPMWGTYWVWDARLTSVLVLFLMYLGLVALWRAIEDPSRAARAAAVLTLVGAINLPIIKFSVDWWNTLHQPASLLRIGAPTIHPAILAPLLVMALAFTLLYLTLYLAAMRNEILRRRVRTMRLLHAQTAQGF